MGSNHSSEASSSHGNNSQQRTPVNSNADLLAVLSGLSISGNDENNLSDIPNITTATSTSSYNNSVPPSLAAAAAIAARHRLLEELQNIVQQRHIDDLTINYNLNNFPSSSIENNHLLNQQQQQYINLFENDENDLDEHQQQHHHAIFHLGGGGGGLERNDEILIPNNNIYNNNDYEDEEEGENEEDDEEEDEEVVDDGDEQHPLSILQQVRNLLRGGQLSITNNRSINMLSDHSTDEEEINQRCPQRQREDRIYFTIPDPKNVNSHMSYKRFRDDIITESGLSFDIPPKSSRLMESTNKLTEEPISEENLFQPSCSSIRSIVRNAKFGVGPPRIQNGMVAPPSRGFTSAIDESQLVAYRNRMTPNRRKIVDRNQTKTFCAHYIRDGEGLLTASQDQNIRIYERRTARKRYVKTCTIEVPYVGWSILDVAVSPNGRHVVYSTWNNVLYQFDLENEDHGWQDMPIDIEDNRFGIFSIKFNSNGSEIMAGTTSGLYIYNRDADRCVMKVDGHEDDINAVCFANEDSNLVLSSGDDGLVKLWDRRTMGYQGDGKPVAVFAGHRDGVTFIDSRGDDRYFLTNSKDQSIKVWDLRIHSCKDGIEATRKSVRSQKWDYRWQYMDKSTIKHTNLPGDSSIMTMYGHSVLHTLIRSRFSPKHTGRRFIYTGCASGSCCVYDLYTGELHKRYQSHKSVVRDCQWHPHDNEIITSSWDGNVHVWRHDPRGPKSKNLDANSQIIQPYDSTDEFDEPLPKTMQEREKRAKQRNCPPPRYNFGLSALNNLASAANNRQARIKYAEEDSDPPATSSEEEESYAAAAKRARRRTRRSNAQD